MTLKFVEVQFWKPKASISINRSYSSESAWKPFWHARSCYFYLAAHYCVHVSSWSSNIVSCLMSRKAFKDALIKKKYEIFKSNGSKQWKFWNFHCYSFLYLIFVCIDCTFVKCNASSHWDLCECKRRSIEPPRSVVSWWRALSDDIHLRNQWRRRWRGTRSRSHGSRVPLCRERSRSLGRHSSHELEAQSSVWSSSRQWCPVDGPRSSRP